MLAASDAGRLFVRQLIIGTISLIVVYIILHALMPHFAPKFVHPSLTESIELTEHGEMVLLDGAAIRWIVGEEKAARILDRMEERTQQVRTLIERVHRQREVLLRHWQQMMGDDARVFAAPDALMRRELDRGDWHLAIQAAQDLSDTYRMHQPELYTAVEEIGDTLSELVRIKTEQIRDLAALKPSQIESFFWASPTGSIVEVFLFGLFGVLTNLLVNSAEYLRTGQFRSAERWVAWTKLVYGPSLAVILVLAIIIGWLDLGDYETRATTLPLAGFMFGYASRRTVSLFDRFTGRILGAASESVVVGPARIAKRRAEFLRGFLSSQEVRTLRAFRTLALDLVEAHVKTALLARGKDIV